MGLWFIRGSFQSMLHSRILCCYFQRDIYIIDCNGQRNKYSMIQYLFEGAEIDIKIKPHGNSKGTATSTKKHIQQLCSTKAVVSELTKERGGEIEARRSYQITVTKCRMLDKSRPRREVPVIHYTVSCLNASLHKVHVTCLYEMLKLLHTP